MRYWLFKSEPSAFSIDDLRKRRGQVSPWDGVRNYQVRNLLRDTIAEGDLAFFYHSSCKDAGIVGMMEVVSHGYPDTTALDLNSDHYDPKSTIENPRWYMVDVKYIKKFQRTISLQEIKSHALLKKMAVARKGNRLSITQVLPTEWKAILALENVNK